MYFLVLVVVYLVDSLLLKNGVEVNIVLRITIGVAALAYLILHTRPLYKLSKALKEIDFSKDEVSFVKLDNLKFHSKLLKRIVDKIRYLEFIILERIDNVNSERFKSEHDKLTGCYNRTRLERMKYKYMNCASLFVMFVDVNNLKKMNDTFGHEAGDALLKSATRKLQYWKDYGDLYRLGGDEFLVVIQDKPENDCMKLVDRWYPKVGNLNRKTDGFRCMLAIGCAFSQTDKDVDKLSKIADERMYEHKKEIKAKYNEELR